MKEERDYVRDLAEIRAMMERTSKFLSLSGWAGIMAGLYGLAGAYLAYKFIYLKSGEFTYSPLKPWTGLDLLVSLTILGLIVLVLALSTAVILSRRKARKRGEAIWNTTSRRLLMNMSVPLLAGGLLILMLISKGYIGFVAPFSLIFYGLALYNASNFTYGEVRMLGLLEILLGLFGMYFVDYGLICWALGFGVLHIVYGIYIHYRYER